MILNKYFLNSSSSPNQQHLSTDTLHQQTRNQHSTHCPSWDTHHTVGVSRTFSVHLIPSASIRVRDGIWTRNLRKPMPYPFGHANARNHIIHCRALQIRFHVTLWYTAQHRRTVQNCNSDGNSDCNPSRHSLSKSKWTTSIWAGLEPATTWATIHCDSLLLLASYHQVQSE